MTDQPLHQFTLAIANLGILLDCPTELIKKRLIEKYQDFVLPGDAEKQVQVIIKIGSAMLDYPAGVHFNEQRMIVSEAGGVGWLARTLDAGELHLAPQASVGTVDYFLRTAFALLAFQAGGFMFHAAAVVKNGQAF